ncbi:MAG: nucleoside triphosphate pyrophosphohydrolase [Methylovulum sp.]|jgi:ATP diphosphatase|nr:nucleoside triphosphate pyrophosphohydrolase [Methylovulum sp.]MCF7997791.1 nucleoside triphosphate pyrophosphohydrolase [Methylovulum sp.]
MLSHTQQLLDIITRLRHPETGCAWDVKQDFASLIPYVIEEAYEVVDAIERGDYDDLRSELGDLLLQVVFHARIAEESGLFNFEQVAEDICAKLIRRHPHVFAEAVFKNDEERHLAWEQAKADERQKKNTANDKLSVLSGVASSLPALMECEKILDRAAQHGFDWPDVAPVFDKVHEELDEIREAIVLGDQAHIQEEVGDLLLVAVNLARHLNVKPEVALKQSTKKFSKRFNYIEQQVEASGRTLLDCQLTELDGFWNAAKQFYKAQKEDSLS